MIAGMVLLSRMQRGMDRVISIMPCRGTCCCRNGLHAPLHAIAKYLEHFSGRRKQKPWPRGQCSASVHKISRSISIMGRANPLHTVHQITMGMSIMTSWQKAPIAHSCEAVILQAQETEWEVKMSTEVDGPISSLQAGTQRSEAVLGTTAGTIW